MDKFEIEVGGAYVKGQDGPFIRVVEDIADGEVQWRDFGRTDGAPIGRGRCSIYAFRNWTGRPATDEERQRLRWDRALKKDIEFLTGLFDRIPDEYLHAEHRDRNLVSRYHQEMLASEGLLRDFLSRVPDAEIVREYKRRKLGRSR